jgi:hypothetical protein
MWIILFNALDDFGVRELNGAPSPPPHLAQIESLQRKVAEEALHGALRIAGLVGRLPYAVFPLPRFLTRKILTLGMPRGIHSFRLVF